MSGEIVEGVDVSNHKNFCTFPWRHLYKHTDHTVKLCCIDQGEPLGDLRVNSLEDIRNNKEFKEIRRQFLRDERPSRCEDCWYTEDNGGISLRQSHFEFQGRTTKNTVYTEEATNPISYLDYRTSNLCNLGCKICSPYFSSKLAQAMASEKIISDSEDVSDKNIHNKGYFLNLHKQRIKQKDLDPILGEDLEYVYFAGGEPLLADEHWEIISKLKEKNLTNIILYYNTNGTLLEYKDKSLLEELKDFSRVTINMSLDGIGESYNYWRTGGDWGTILSNLNKIKKFRDDGYSNFILGVTSTVGWMNFKEVFKLHKFLVDNKYVLKDENLPYVLNMQPVTDVKGCIFEDTPTMFIPELLEYMDEYENWRINNFKDTPVQLPDYTTHFKKLIEKRQYSTDKLRDWILTNKKLDRYFTTNFSNVYKFKTKNFNSYLQELYNNPDEVTPIF